jgi:hypothetical protein
LDKNAIEVSLIAESPTSTPYNWGGIWANNVIWYFIVGAVKFQLNFASTRRSEEWV